MITSSIACGKLTYNYYVYNSSVIVNVFAIIYCKTNTLISVTDDVTRIYNVIIIILIIWCVKLSGQLDHIINA